MKKQLFNPFIYIAGGKSLAIGCTAMMITALLGFLNKLLICFG